MSGSFWAYREAAEIPDRDDCAPDIRILWDKVHTARKPHLCDGCGDEIAPGSRYRSVGLIMDGARLTQKTHGEGPTTCPRFAERDRLRAERERAELAEQFEKDRAEFFPQPTGDTHVS